MWQFLRDLWRYTVTRPENPIYKRELTGWTYTQFFARLRRGCLPLFALFFVFTAAMCTLPTLASIGLQDPTQLVIIPYVVILAFYISGEILLFVAGFLATALTATAVSSEIEAQSYRLLRLTPYTPREIMFTKYSAAMFQMRLPIALNLLTRVGSAVAAIGYTIVLLVIASVGVTELLGMPAPIQPTPVLPATTIPLAVVFDSLVVLAVMAVLTVIGTMLFVVEPAMRLAMFAAIGLLASSLSKTRTNGLIAAIFVRGGYAVVAYVAAQTVQFLLLPVFTLISVVPGVQTLFTTRPALAAALSLLVVAAGLSVRLLLPVIVTSGSLLLTERRAGRLPYNIA